MSDTPNDNAPIDPTVEMIRRAYEDGRRLLEGHKGPLESIGRDGYLAMIDPNITEVSGRRDQQEDQ